MRPFCLIESRSQNAAANAGVLCVYLKTILYHYHQLFIDIERENIHHVSLLELPATTNLYNYVKTNLDVMFEINFVFEEFSTKMTIRS